MTHEEIYRRIAAIVAQNFGVNVEALRPETHFFNDLGASLDFEETILECETEFSIRFPDELPGPATVDGLTGCIHQMLNGDQGIWPPPPASR